VRPKTWALDIHSLVVEPSNNAYPGTFRIRASSSLGLGHLTCALKLYCAARTCNACRSTYDLAESEASASSVREDERWWVYPVNIDEDDILTDESTATHAVYSASITASGNRWWPRTKTPPCCNLVYSMPARTLSNRSTPKMPIRLSTLAVATVQTFTKEGSISLKDRQHRVLFSQPLPAAPLWADSAKASCKPLTTRISNISSERCSKRLTS
jgi:hypothetical protein